MKKTRALITLGLLVLQPIIVILLAMGLGYFNIDFTVLTIGNLWDIIWISTLIWFAIAIPIIIVAFRMGIFEDKNNNGNSFISGFFMILFWIVAFFRGLFPQTISSLSFAILWEVIWITIVVIVGLAVIIYIITYFFQISGKMKRRN